MSTLQVHAGSAMTIMKMMSQGQFEISELPTQLGSETQRLKAEVEARFGKCIECSFSPEMRESAAAYLSEDQSPNIQFRDSTNTDETTIFHELSHLNLIAEGFALYELEMDAVAQQNHELFQRLYQTIRAALQHAIFFPLMRAKGFDPTADVRSKVKRAKPAPRGNRARDLSDFVMAVDLFATMLSRDDDAIDVHRESLLERGWEFSVQKAEESRAISERTVFATPTGEAEAVVAILGALFQGQFTFTLDSWKGDLQKHSGYQLNVATIRVRFEPATPAQSINYDLLEDSGNL